MRALSFSEFSAVSGGNGDGSNDGDGQSGGCPTNGVDGCPSDPGDPAHGLNAYNAYAQVLEPTLVTAPRETLDTTFGLSTSAVNAAVWAVGGIVVAGLVTVTPAGAVAAAVATQWGVQITVGSTFGLLGFLHSPGKVNTDQLFEDSVYGP